MSAPMSSLVEFLKAEKRAMRVEEVSRLLDVSPKHVYRLVTAGRIPFMRPGGLIRFDPGRLAGWLEERST